MKKIKYIIMLVVATLMSCSDDFFDIAPTTTLSDASFWKNESDAFAALSACYEYYAGFNAGYDCITDDAFDITNYMPYDDIGLGLVAPAYPQIDLFSNYYKIRDCNNFIDRVAAVDMDEDLKEKYIAEVKFIRAYDYFWKLMYHGGVPIIDKLVTPDEASIERDSEEDVVSWLLDELEDIAAVLPEKNLIESNGHFTKGSALGLKARIELYFGMYTEAMQDAQTVMNMSCYELYNSDGSYTPVEGYKRLFSAEAESENREALFSAAYLDETYTAGYWQTILPSEFDSYGVLNPTQNLVNVFEYDDGTVFDPLNPRDPASPFANRDPRLYASILLPGDVIADVTFNPFDIANRTYYKNNAIFGYLMEKYTPSAETAAEVDKFKSDIDVMQMRLAEIYLIYAEAAIESNQINQSVYDAINSIRNRAGMPDVDQLTYGDQASLRDLVRRERRVELCLEGLRYFDIKRWEIGETAMKGALKVTVPSFTYSGSVPVFDYSISTEETVFTRTFVPPGYLFPIPQSAIDKNDLLEQNTGY
jgi:hypothetical protein